ncbi:CapA family protein [Paracoccus marinaquae]|uniref:CapA family protein n=1 Tax=Paracoccus marinaquae TaxID=2841926 RepID=A0ABS6AP48_9RHOB|nr:CapA family protein [Paracoccus marinaquae]MBU3032378.1 CapA family protein [Paracoccus marinaquae]
MTTISLLATGDSMLTRKISRAQDADFRDLVAMMRDTDVTITNLEMSYPGRGRHPSTTMHGTPMSADPAHLSEFAEIGVDLFALGNNHATDYGTEGLLSTIEALEQRGMPYAGAGRNLTDARAPRYFDTPGGRVALISAGSSNARLALAADIGIGDAGRPGIAPIRVNKTHYINKYRFEDLRGLLEEAGVNVTSSGTTAPGIHFPYPDKNIYDGPPPGGIAVESVHFVPDERPRVQTDALERDIEALVASVDEAHRMADLVFVALHCHEGLQGRWNTDTPAEFLRPLAHRLIDAGAHAILGHGPHMLRGVEIYKDRPICYSLGNFIFNLEATETFPLEVYEQQGMPLTSRTADLYDRVTGYQKQPYFWEAVVARFEFTDGRLTGSELHPIRMGQDLPRPQRGTPRLVTPEEARNILERLGTLSLPFGTKVELVENGERCFGRMTKA